jgi:ABC-type ATPase with predicted acetyltransferase domain
MSKILFFNNWGLIDAGWEVYVLDGAFILVCLLVVFGLYSGFDDWLGKWEESSGEIVDELYTPEINSTGVGTGIGTNGQLTTMVTSSHSPERWHVVVREDVTNDVIKLGCSMQFVYEVKPTDRVAFRNKYGKFSKDYLKSELISKL